RSARALSPKPCLPARVLDRGPAAGAVRGLRGGAPDRGDSGRRRARRAWGCRLADPARRRGAGRGCARARRARPATARAADRSGPRQGTGAHDRVGDPARRRLSGGERIGGLVADLELELELEAAEAPHTQTDAQAPESITRNTFFGAATQITTAAF